MVLHDNYAEYQFDSKFKLRFYVQRCQKCVDLALKTADKFCGRQTTMGVTKIFKKNYKISDFFVKNKEKLNSLTTMDLKFLNSPCQIL